jgi:hypothetical protein
MFNQPSGFSKPNSVDTYETDPYGVYGSKLVSSHFLEHKISFVKRLNAVL